jgi:hypothetical protein
LKEAVMSAEGRVAEATVRIRTPRPNWTVLLAAGAIILMTSLLFHPNFSDPVPLVLGGVFVGEALWIRTFGVDLTAESANVRGIRRRSVTWSQVQAVLAYRQMGASRVALVLDSGERVALREPSTYWGSGAATAARYEEDFHRLGQWWLAHRGSSWRPVRPEAPGAPIQR